MIFRYKSFRKRKGRLYSWAEDKDEWKIGEWKKVEGKIQCCKNGFHCCTSPEIVRTFTNYGAILKVEVRGRSDKTPAQEAWSEMRVIQQQDENYGVK